MIDFGKPVMERPKCEWKDCNEPAIKPIPAGGGRYECYCYKHWKEKIKEKLKEELL